VYDAVPVDYAAPVYQAEYATYVDYADYTEFVDYSSATPAVGAEIDLRPAAAVPVRTQEPQIPAELPAAEPRPLRSAVLAVRDEVGFDVAAEVARPVRDPYTVPGVVMPRQRPDGLPPALPPARPVAPERLYRPYMGGDQGTTVNAAPVDLTMYDETQQMAKIEHRETGTG
jgi:hypothetical protein